MSEASSSETEGSSGSGYLHPILKRRDGSNKIRRSGKSKKSTRRTTKLRRPKYDPEKAKLFDSAKLAAWASKQEDPQTVRDMTDLTRALAADSKRNYLQC